MAEQRPDMGAARAERRAKEAVDRPVAVAGLSAAPPRGQAERPADVTLHPA
jgi:hypothetical protein